ncbi:MAG TPA: efflux RND transporter periplasmic adaptor subunit [Roseiarcus sp.]|nr:efflux RND transporter periplasmic adaptor subunit [Roseiarcus sp.]
MRAVKWTAATLAALALATLAGLRLAGERPDSAKAAAPAPYMMAMPVPVFAVVKKTLPIYLNYPGRVEAIRGISLQARVSGYIEAEVARDGADVKAGDLLYKIDPRDLQVALDSARAAAERDAAVLAYAQGNFSRGQDLMKNGYVAKDAYDQRLSAKRAAEAALDVDKAAVEAAVLNLGYAEIRAPFAGRLGRNQAAKGALVGPASGALNTLMQLDPVYVAFNPSESELAEIRAARAAGKVEAQVSVPGAPSLTRKGELTFLDNVIDHSTGTIAARITLDNPDSALLPGQYVRVKLLLRDEPDALMAPEVALGSNQMGKFVYVVSHDDKAELRQLELGPSDGKLVNVVHGLSEGDKVIVGNLQKIGPGSPVKPLPGEVKAHP